MKANFVKTIIPTDQYKEVEEIGDLVICHFDPKEIAVTDGDGNETTMTECCEGSTQKDGYDPTAMQEAYGAWKARLDARSLAQAVQGKLSDIEAYDQSDKVNGFSLNGLTVWLDKATRVGLMNSTTIAKNMGQETTTVWFGGISMTIPCDTAIGMLSALEMYALACFNVTAGHKAAVQALTSVDEVMAYDYSTNYPEQLSLSV